MNSKVVAAPQSGELERTMEPSAQGENNANGNAEATKGEGIQKRIDELVGQREQWKRESERLSSQLEQMMGVQVQMAGQLAQLQQPTQQPQVEVDPDTAKQFQALMAPFLGEIRQSIAGLNDSLGSMKLEQRMSGVPAEVATEMKTIAANAKKAGYPLSDADVYNMAYGKYAAKRDAEAQAAKTKTQFNGAGGNIPGQSAVPMNPAGTDTTPPAPPMPNIHDHAAMSAWIAEMDKRVGDKPL